MGSCMAVFTVFQELEERANTLQVFSCITFAKANHVANLRHQNWKVSYLITEGKPGIWELCGVIEEEERKHRDK